MEADLRRHLLWAFYLPSILTATAWAMMVPVLPVFGRGLTASFTLIGLLLAGQAIGHLVMDIPAGFILRRYGTKNTMLLAVAISIVAMLLLIPVNNIWLATLLLIAAGTGQSIYNIARHNYITVLARPQVRGRAIGLLGGVYRMGKFLGPVIGGLVAGTAGLRVVFVVFVVLYALAGLTVVLFMRKTKMPQLHERSHLAVFQDTVRDNRNVFATAGVGQVFAQLTRTGWTWAIPLYAAEVLQLDVDTIGYVVGAGAAMDAMLFYTSGILMDRFGRKWAIVPAFVVQATGVLLIPFTGSALALAAVAALIGTGNATSSGTMMTLGGDFAPPETRGEFLGVWRFIGDVGATSAPLIVGAVAQALVLQASVFTIAGFGYGTALWFALLVPETLRKAQSAPVTGE
ncbi:MAG: MFS transporter [Chloroflexota bacterium]